MIARAQLRRRPNAGFSLLETLIAVTLLALLITLVFRGLRFGSQAWTSLDRRTEATATSAAVLGVLRRTIAESYPAFASNDLSDRRVFFEGGAENLALVSPLPAAIAAGVLGHQRVFVASDASGLSALYLAWRLDLPGSDGQDLTEKRVKLADHIRSIHFAYFGTARSGGLQGWSDRWVGQRRLPELVRVRIEDAALDVGLWPELFAEPRTTTPAGCVYDPSDVVCRRVQ